MAQWDDPRTRSGNVAVLGRPVAPHGRRAARAQRPPAGRAGTARPGPRSGAHPGRVAPVRVERSSRTRPAPAPGLSRDAVFVAGLVALLTLIGLVMVLSASSADAIRQGASPWGQFEKQVMWVFLGTGAFAAGAVVDYRTWRRFSLVLLTGVVLLLLAVLVPGVGLVVNGSRRWLGAGSWRIQPSEIAKLALVLFTADLLARRADRMEDTRFTFRPVALVVVICGALVMKQPDMGTTIVLCSIAAAVLFVAGCPARTLALAGLAATAIGGLLGVVAPYRMHRLLSFLHPEKDAGNTGYQAVQGRVGMATGRWLGLGLGAGRVKTGYLPNAQTDFIFAVIGEELGFVGCLVVIALFVALAVIGVRIAAKAPDRFGTLLAVGVTAWIVVQALVNVGAVVGLLPVTGVPLPFVSFGGSSMVITMVGMGMLASVAHRSRRVAAA